MKNRMYLLTIVAATGMNAAANAPGEFPYIAPVHCQNVINAPLGSSPFYRSETCNTVYVLPPEAGEIEYSVRADAVNDQDCDEMDQLRVDRKRVNAKKAALEDEALKPGISQAKLELYTKQIELADKALKSLKQSEDYLGALEGAAMTVRLSARHVAEVERFFDINKDAFRNGVNFEPAPIAESYVSFDTGSESTPSSRPAVIRTNIPGVEVRGIGSAPQSDSRIMNGSVSGVVVLGLNAICNMRKAEGVGSVSKIAYAPAKMEAYIPANLTFSVPVLSSYAFTASMNYEVIVRDLLTQLESRPDKFTVNMVKDRIIDAIASKNVNWDFRAYELQDRGATAEQLLEIERTEKEALFADWARELADHLVKLGVLEKMEPVPVPAPEAGTVEETRYRQMCRSKSFLGVRYSHRCWEEPYRVVHLRGGSAENTIEELRKLNLNFVTSMRYSQPIFRTHTTTFKYREVK